jgi:hypothetical protein
MSERGKELAQKLAELRERSAAQRDIIAREVSSIEARFSSVDRVVAVARRSVLRPSVLALGAVVLVLFGRARALRLLARAWFVASTARRVLRALAQ